MNNRNHRSNSLDYLQAMLREMRSIGQAERCDILAYMIEMAYIECSDVIRGERPTRLPSNQLDDDRAGEKRRIIG